MPHVRKSIFVVLFCYSYIEVLNSQFCALKENLGMVYTARSITFKKQPIRRFRAKSVPCVCAHKKIFEKVRQLYLKYTQHKYLVDWTFSKKDMMFQSQQKLRGELWTLSLKTSANKFSLYGEYE